MRGYASRATDGGGSSEGETGSIAGGNRNRDGYSSARLSCAGITRIRFQGSLSAPFETQRFRSGAPPAGTIGEAIARQRAFQAVAAESGANEVRVRNESGRLRSFDPSGVLFPTVFRHERLRLIHLVTGLFSDTETPPASWYQGPKSTYFCRSCRPPRPTGSSHKPSFKPETNRSLFRQTTGPYIQTTEGPVTFTQRTPVVPSPMGSDPEHP